MTGSHAHSPAEGANDPGGQIAKMILFIEQEALEKIREVKVKASGEAIKEQGRIIMAETQAITESQEKRLKINEISRKIEHTTNINRYRLELYKERQRLLNELFDELRNRIAALREDKPKYKKVMEGLILQAMYGIVHSPLRIQCIKEDVSLVEGMISTLAKTYEQKTSLKVELQVDKENFLPTSCYGGIVASGSNGVFIVDNTLKEKVDVLYNRIPPNLSHYLFEQ